MKSENSDIIRSIFILLEFVFLVFIGIYLPNYMLTSSNSVRFVIMFLITGFILFGTIFDIVHTVRKKKYRTTVFIVIANILMALSFIGFGVLYFIHVSPNEFDKMILLSRLNTGLTITFAIGFVLQQFCRRDKYLRKAEQKPVE